MNRETTESDSQATDPLDTLLVTHYQTIRDEILARMEMRQTALTVYLGFVGTIFGLAIVETPYRNVSILVPFMTFGIFWIIRDHELAIAHLGRWIRDAYVPYLHKAGLDPHLPRWEDSEARRAYGEKILFSRYVTYLFVFVGSSVAGITIAVTDPTADVHWAWIASSILVTTLTVLFTILTLRRRHRIGER
jgi:hypothetical protein